MHHIFLPVANFKKMLGYLLIAYSNFYVVALFIDYLKRLPEDSEDQKDAAGGFSSSTTLDAWNL